MSLETTTTIAGLSSSNPASGDSQQQGDDHLRLIKTVLKNIFPGSGGTGFSIPITATEAELNYVNGVTSAIQTQLNDAKFTAGTVMLFGQATAPTGWTKLTTHNDKMIRVVSGGTGGTAGGTDSPILMNKVPSHTHDFTSDVESRSHTHQYTSPDTGVASYAAGGTIAIPGRTLGTPSANANQTHTHAGTTDANGSASNWAPKYYDIILCSKN